MTEIQNLEILENKKDKSLYNYSLYVKNEKDTYNDILTRNKKYKKIIYIILVLSIIMIPSIPENKSITKLFIINIIFIIFYFFTIISSKKRIKKIENDFEKKLKKN